MEYRYTLDKSAKKYLCPQCKEKRFVLYVDTTKNKYLNDFVGRCDKESSCGYHYPPKAYFSDYPQAKDTAIFAPQISIQCQIPKLILESISVLPYYLVERSENRTETNHFISYLQSLFSFDKVQQAVHAYHIGTSKRWNGATIFWQIDEKMQVRTGKILPYHAETGKRLKMKGVPQIDFVHSILIREKRLQAFSLSQAPFGLHLVALDTTKTIAAVESEKTAVIMSIILPDYIWLSFGGLNNLNQLNTPALKDRKVIVFPDAGTYDKLSYKITHLKNEGFNIIMSNLLESKATEAEKTNGYDLADFAITNNWYDMEHKNNTEQTKIIIEKLTHKFTNWDK